MDDQMVGQMREAFDHYLERGEKSLRSDRIAQVHRDYATTFKFQVPIEPRCLVQMIHPHFGYLSHLPNIDFDKMVQIYQAKLVASYEKELGQELLANEITALAYWQYFDTHNTGYQSLPEFTEFLKTFRFQVSVPAFENEFRFALSQHPGELAGEETIVRWEFFRYLFLERNL